MQKHGWEKTRLSNGEWGKNVMVDKDLEPRT